MTEHFKAPEKIQLSDEEIANLLDAQFKIVVVEMEIFSSDHFLWVLPQHLNPATTFLVLHPQVVN